MTSLSIHHCVGPYADRLMYLDAEMQRRMKEYDLRSPDLYFREYDRREVEFIAAIDRRTMEVRGTLRYRLKFELSNYPAFLPQFDHLRDLIAVDLGGSNFGAEGLKKRQLHAMLMAPLGLIMIGRSEDVIYAQVRTDKVEDFLPFGFEIFTEPFTVKEWGANTWYGIGVTRSRVWGRRGNDGRFGHEVRDFFRNATCEHLLKAIQPDALLEVLNRPAAPLPESCKLSLPPLTEFVDEFPSALPGRHAKCQRACVLGKARRSAVRDTCRTACWLMQQGDR